MFNKRVLFNFFLCIMVCCIHEYYKINEMMKKKKFHFMVPETNQYKPLNNEYIEWSRNKTTTTTTTMTFVTKKKQKEVTKRSTGSFKVHCVLKIYIYDHNTHRHKYNWSIEQQQQQKKMRASLIVTNRIVTMMIMMKQPESERKREKKQYYTQ